MLDNDVLNEGLRPLDLEELVYPLFEIDTYKSKMGEDRDVCVLSFKVKERNPARDLMEFIEKGYGFVLDADVSSGENANGEYFVFVELKRTPRLTEEIKEITLGVKRLTGIDDWKFKYHKSNERNSLESLKEAIPSTPDRYELYLRQIKTEDLKRFFNKTLMDDLTVENDIITIFKPFGNTFSFKILKEDEKTNVLENIEISPMMDYTAMGEVLWLTKIFGDYNIVKTNDGFVFENGDRAMILQRIYK